MLRRAGTVLRARRVYRWSLVCSTLFCSWSAGAAAEQVCTLNVSIKGSSCTITPSRAETECTSYRYQVDTDHEVTLQARSGPATPCGQGCTLEGGDADAPPALKVQSADAPEIECVLGKRPPPAARPAKSPLAKAVKEAVAPSSRAHGAVAPPAPGGAKDERVFPRVELELQLEGQATGSAQVLDELFQTVAAVALERAQARAAQRLIDATAAALCGQRTSDALGSWPRTCEVLEHLTPATLGTAAEALRQALSGDVAEWLARHAQLRSKDDQQYLQEVFLHSLAPLLRRPGNVTREELLRLLNALVTHEWEGMNADVLNLAFYLVRICGKQAEREECDVGAAADAALTAFDGADPLLAKLKAERLQIEAIAGRLTPLLAKRALKSAELRRVAIDVVDVALMLPEQLAPATLAAAPESGHDAALGRDPEQLKQARLLLLAMLNDDAFSLALRVSDLLEGQRLDPKVHALLNAVLAYARTYQHDVPEGQDPAERRKQIVEALVASATERSQRSDDWIVSLGVDVGVEALGYQNIDGDPSVVTPQLMLPLGVFVQHGPAGGWPGLHAGFFFVDVAQYASYQSDGTTNDPRWDTAIAIGGQIGAVLGSIADPFVLGIDARYAPTLFSDASSSDPATGGTFRIGIFANYYVPFFDLN